MIWEIKIQEFMEHFFTISFTGKIWVLLCKIDRIFDSIFLVVCLSVKLRICNIAGNIWQIREFWQSAKLVISDCMPECEVEKARNIIEAEA